MPAEEWGRGALAATTQQRSTSAHQCPTTAEWELTSVLPPQSGSSPVSYHRRLGHQCPTTAEWDTSVLPPQTGTFACVTLSHS